MLARFACPKICEDLGASTLQSVSARRARQLARLQLEVGISAATDQPPGNAPINVGVGLADDAALVASVASSDCAECPDHSSQATSHEQKKAEMIHGASGRLTALAVECRGAAEAAVAENVAVIEAHWAEAALLLKPPPSPPPSPPSRAIEGGCVEDESAEALSNMAAGETSYCPNQRNKLPLPRGLPRPLPISLWILLPNSSIPPPPPLPSSISHPPRIAHAGNPRAGELTATGCTASVKGSWALPGNGTEFDLRIGPDYKKFGKKAPSAENIYELVGADAFKRSKGQAFTHPALSLPTLLHLLLSQQGRGRFTRWCGWGALMLM